LESRIAAGTSNTSGLGKGKPNQILACLESEAQRKQRLAEKAEEKEKTNIPVPNQDIREKISASTMPASWTS